MPEEKHIISYPVCSLQDPCTKVAVLTERLNTLEELLKEIRDEVLKEIKHRYPREITLFVGLASLIMGILGAIAFR